MKCQEPESHSSRTSQPPGLTDELDVGDPVCPEDELGGSEHARVEVGAHDPSRWADPLAQDPQPAQHAATDVEGSPARSSAEAREQVPSGRLPHERLQLQALQLRGLIGQKLGAAVLTAPFDRHDEKLHPLWDLVGLESAQGQRVGNTPRHQRQDRGAVVFSGQRKRMNLCRDRPAFVALYVTSRD